jgi:hypothetical protein
MSTDVSAEPKPKSRWTLFLDRWNEGCERHEPVFQRFKGAFNAFSLASDRRVNPLLLAALSVGAIALTGLMVYGAVWLFSHPKLYLLFLFLKSAKWVLIGGAFVAALVLRNWVMKRGDGGEPAPK